tara:strand:+ start:104 stop:1273 length:1170 start_codon:yes stop_codon:yes gene_type:complete
MRKLFYMGLEKYEGRYTLQLEDWNERVFKKRGLDYVLVPGETLDNSKTIVTGQVLDAHGRSYFGMSQIMNLVKMMREGEVTTEDVIFFEDMFQPGIESLPYIMDQVPEEMRPKVYVRCLAQTIDPDDFVHVWGMYPWMSKYEQMIDAFVDGVICASEEMVANLHIAGWKANKYVTGLPFGKEEVQSRVKDIVPFDKRMKRVVFAARWDQEKQPNFYMDLIEAYLSKWDQEVEFFILSGGRLRSNNDEYMARTKQMSQDGLLRVQENLSKDEYYDILSNSRVLFNCALQDWVSNTVSEADSLYTNVLYPAYRSFPETFGNDADRLYVPWNIDDACNKLWMLIDLPHDNIGKISDYQNGTIDRTVDIFEGNGEEYLRSGVDYRRHTSGAKF